ncbi:MULTISPECIES: polysaccharide deacetylase family protein [unclassified Leucobacter]|uniref:polysaccharide deacetylase family protein n=1 Tax=unclassified Leucobacter TaxID=2621730 RepID=UPI00165EB731|nr:MULTISPECIES: polysaccharide deacetylase family protein [unclassified Leucobacter]MBC9936972.1 polysaccharide deacetylase family protein [Leucobacter sp. cx-87]
MDDAGVTAGMARPRASASRLRVAMRRCAATSVVALAVGLAGCAPEPIVHSTHPEMLPRIELADIVAPPEPLDAAAVPGLFPQRIVPSGAPWASARWSQLPGETPLNLEQQSWVHAEMGAFAGQSGAPAFHPRASPAGSGGASRGCSRGSTQVAAGILLADPALAPVAPAGAPVLALNCDVIFASGGLLGIRSRSTSVDAAGVLSDLITVGYSVNGAELAPAADFVDPARLGELGELLLASLGYRDLPTMFVPAAIARPLTAAESESLGLARLIADPVPAADGSMVFAIALADLPGGGAGFTRLAAWAKSGALRGAHIAVRVERPERWLSEGGRAALGIAVAAAPPSWQAVAAGRQSIDCGLVPCVAVTFDDGPGADSERLLQVLAETNSAASFFLMGSAVSVAPGMAAAELANGHTVANHSWSHPDLTKLSKEQVREQVMQAQRAITDATGSAPRYFRPPYGALNSEVMAEIPLPIVLWSIDTNDWRGPGVDALVERVSGAGPGDIILFHDTHASTVDAMPRVIGELQDRGLELVTLDDLLGDQPTGVRISRG